MGLLDDAKSSVSKWFEEQVAKNKAFKAAGGMGKSNPAMTRSMGLLPATGLLEQEGDAAARADAAYGALRKEYGPLGLRPGDFVPFASGGLAFDDARLAAAKGNYGQAAGSLAGVIPVAGAVGKVVRKITGGKSSGVVDSVKREIFAGPNAKTANKAAMKRAEARLAAGDDPATVWAQEGWGRGPDGKMRFELDDSGSGMRMSGPKAGASEYAYQRLPEAYDNKQLYAAYPDAKKTILTWNDTPDSASYTAQNEWAKYVDIPQGIQKKQQRKMLAHEGQHIVQDAEDFSRGGSPEGMRDEALAMLRRDVASGDIGSTEQAMNMLPMAQRNAYNRLAGEAESRLTEARIDMSPAERAAQYPWAEDYFKQATGVSKGDLIHRGGLLSDGPALSVGKADINRFETEADRRMAAAQRNAAKPVSEGGLGLHPNNTPMERAKALGFADDAYHGTNADISAMNTGGRGKTAGAGAFVTDNPLVAETYFSGSGGGNILPLKLKKEGLLEVNAKGRNWADIGTNTLAPKSGKKRYALDDLELDRNSATTTDELGSIAGQLGLKGVDIKNVKDIGTNSHIFRAKEYLSDKYGVYPNDEWSNVSGKQFAEARDYLSKMYGKQKSNITAVQDPSMLRSRFAAFDPMRRNESDLLALNGQKTGSGLLNPEITKATNRGLYRTMLDDEEDKPSFPYGLIGK